MASARRLDIVQILESVADDLNRRAREIAAATVGVDVLACAAALIVVAEDLEEEGTAPATVH
jgi:hypothetical protein